MWRARVATTRAPSLVPGLAVSWLVVCALPGLAFAETVTIELRGGDQVSGELISRDDRETVIEHPVFGRLVVPTDRIKPGDGDQPGLFGTSFLAGWRKELGLGLTGQEGNSPEANFLLTAGLHRETEAYRYEFEGHYKIATEDSDRTSNYADLRSRRDWLFPGTRWFAAVGSHYQYDEFEPWQHRIQVMVAPGYQLYDREGLEVAVLGGPSYMYEFGEREESRPEMLAGVEATWKPRKGQRLRLRHYFFQQLNEADWRMRTRVEWRMAILGSEHLGLVLGVDNEYDTAAEDERNNLKYWSRLSYDF